MIFIVLAAGKGMRLGSLTKNAPKPLVPLPDGSTLMTHHIAAMEQTPAISQMLVVSGFLGHKIDEMVGWLRQKKPIHVQYNPFYNLTGPVASVWLVSEPMAKTDFLLCNGDTFYSTRALTTLTQQPDPGIVLGIERGGFRSNDDMKVMLRDDGRLQRVGKDIPLSLADGISAGLLAVKGVEMRYIFVNTLAQIVRDQENIKTSVPWHSLLNKLLGESVEIGVTDLLTTDWHEVDTVTDIYQLQEIL